MKFLIRAAVLTAALALAQQASAATRLGEGVMGAVAGGLVAGPVGAVAGGAIGYTQGHKISHSIFHHRRRHYYWRNHHRYYYYR